MTMNATSAAAAPVEAASVDLDGIRSQFPALHQTVRDKPLVYLDSAATALKPRRVVDAVRTVYERDCANIHRGVHLLSQRATRAYEDARQRVADLLHAESAREIVFVRNTTEAINLVAQSWARSELRPGDEVLITGLEHHSNIVPWQMVCAQTGAKLVVVPIDDRGDVDMAELEARLGDRTRLVAVAHVSNALGTVLPVARIARAAHARGARVLVDGAQAVPHMAVDVQELGCDFYAFSAHKLYGPTGVGVLWGRLPLLEAMPPYQGGGDMIRSVTFEKTTYGDVPHKFEAGTPHIAGVVGLGAAVDFVQEVGYAAIEAHEQDLLARGTEALGKLDGVRLIGTAPHKLGVLSFVLEGIHPHDIGTVLDTEGVALRAGHHCAQPVMAHFGVPATVRASLGIYNGPGDLEALVGALDKVRELFG